MDVKTRIILVLLLSSIAVELAKCSQSDKPGRVRNIRSKLHKPVIINNKQINRQDHVSTHSHKKTDEQNLNPAKCLTSKVFQALKPATIDCFSDKNERDRFQKKAKGRPIDYRWKTHEELTLTHYVKTKDGHLKIDQPLPKHSGTIECTATITTTMAKEITRSYNHHILVKTSPGYSFEVSLSKDRKPGSKCDGDFMNDIMCSIECIEPSCSKSECRSRTSANCEDPNRIVYQIESAIHHAIGNKECDHICISHLKTSAENTFKEFEMKLQDHVSSDEYKEFKIESDMALIKTCPEGHFLKGGTVCLPCAPGTYQPKPPQYSSLNEASDVEKNECLLCPEGHWQDLYGQTSCNLCPVGTELRYEGAAKVHECHSEKTETPNYAPDSCTYWKEDQTYFPVKESLKHLILEDKEDMREAVKKRLEDKVDPVSDREGADLVERLGELDREIAIHRLEMVPIKPRDKMLYLAMVEELTDKWLKLKDIGFKTLKKESASLREQVGHRINFNINALKELTKILKGDMMENEEFVKKYQAVKTRGEKDISFVKDELESAFEDMERHARAREKSLKMAPKYHKGSHRVEHDDLKEADIENERKEVFKIVDSEEPTEMGTSLTGENYEKSEKSDDISDDSDDTTVDTDDKTDHNARELEKKLKTRLKWKKHGHKHKHDHIKDKAQSDDGTKAKIESNSDVEATTEMVEDQTGSDDQNGDDAVTTEVESVTEEDEQSFDDKEAETNENDTETVESGDKTDHKNKETAGDDKVAEKQNDSENEANDDDVNVSADEASEHEDASTEADEEFHYKRKSDKKKKRSIYRTVKVAKPKRHRFARDTAQLTAQAKEASKSKEPENIKNPKPTEAPEGKTSTAEPKTTKDMTEARKMMQEQYAYKSLAYRMRNNEILSKHEYAGFPEKSEDKTPNRIFTLIMGTIFVLVSLMGLAVIIVTFVLALPLYIEKKEKIVDDGLGLKPKVYTRVNLEDPRFGTTKTVLSTTRPYRLHEITEVDMMDPPMLVIANEGPLDGPDLV